MLQADSPEAIITVFIDAIHPHVIYLICTTAFSSCLLTLLVVLLAFSTSESRRRPVFHLNLLAICLALILGVLNVITNGAAILYPFHLASKNVYISRTTFAFFAPLFYDSILLFRLFALYPLAITPGVTLVKIFAFPFFIKCTRIIVISLFLSGIVEATTRTASFVQDPQSNRFRNPYLIAEWSMQIADNLYAVSFFLCKFHARTLNFERASSLAERLRQIFYLSVANFVFPLLFNIGKIICISVSRRRSTVTMLLLMNNYVPVIGILCATIWFSGTDWARTHGDPELPHSDRMGSGRRMPGNAPQWIIDPTVATDSIPGSAMQSTTLPRDDGPFVFRHYA